VYRLSFERQKPFPFKFSHFIPLAIRAAFCLSILAALSQASSAGPKITLVQHTSIDAGTTSATLPFLSDNTAGNWIAVCIRAGAANEMFTVTDTNQNAYKKAIQFSLTVDSDTIGIFYAENIVGGANTITVSDTESATLRFAILEYSGVATSGSLDMARVMEGSSASPSSGVVTTTATGDLILGTILTSDPETYTAGSGNLTEENVPVEPGTKLIVEDQVQAAAGAVSAGATLGAAGPWAAAVAAFRAAVGGGRGTAPTITISAGTVFKVGAAGSLAITATGTPTPSLAETGALPSGVTFSDNGNGSATLSGTPATGTAGTYPLTITARNGAGTDASQSFTLTVTSATLGFVQVNFATPQGPQTAVSVTYTQAQAAGDINVVVAGWNDSTAQIGSVTDSVGNAYLLAVGPTVQSGTATQAIYYAKKIAAAGANANTVTVTFNTGANSPDVRIAEYSGIDPSNPVDAVAAGQGRGTASDSGSVNTGNANDLLVGANLVQQTTSTPGSGYASRLITSPDGDILEDEIVTKAGSQSATAAVTGGAWIMQTVAFRTAASGVGTGVSVAVSSKLAAITTSQSQQFTASINDPENGGVSWSVDGISGGDATTGAVSTTGLFTPGSQVGVHTVTATSNSNPLVSASVTIAVTDLGGVFTYHNDTARTGQNLQEYALTTATVNSATFGVLFSCPVDGYIYAQPLYIANFMIGGQTRNVVFVATEHDSVYAFDADSASCVQLWHTSFLSSGVTTVPPADTGETGDLIPEIGITSTPVIDLSSNTICIVAKTKETVGPDCSTVNPCYFHRLHALSLTTGEENSGSPVMLSAPNFVPLFHLQRPALLLNNGTLYVAFGSHGDNNTYQGWMMAYDSSSLAQQWVWSSTDPTSGNNQGAIWGSGNGPAVDVSGNIYVETGNGVFDGTTNFSDSVVKLSPSGTVLDYFTPFDQDVMQQNDIDLGSSGPIILPDDVGSGTNPHLMIATGKVGIVYLLDQANLGQYNPAANQDLGEVSIGFNTTDITGGFFGQPAYWNGNIYTIIVGDYLRQFPISNGAISTVSNSNSTNTFSFRGATPAVSASGTSNGIVWVADTTAYQSGGAVILDAYDATNVSTPLYSSPASGPGAAAPATKFTVPTVANGKVYVGGQLAFTVFGLLPN